MGAASQRTMKAFYVIKREYLENVRKKSFIISTLLVPVLLLGFTFVPMLVTFLEPGSQIELAVLDWTGEIGGEFISALSDTLEDGKPKYVLKEYPGIPGDPEEARGKLIGELNSDKLGIVVEVPEDVYTSRKIYYFTRDVGNVQVLEKFETILSRVVMRNRLARAGLDYDKIKNLTRGVSLDVRRVTKTGAVEKKGILGEWGLVFAFIMILYMTLLTWGMSIQRSLIEEKSSRVIEVLLSSCDPMDIFFGKIIGLGTVGLTQLFIWTVTSLSIGFYIHFALAQFAQYIDVAPMVFFYFILFYILGFLFYSSIFSLVGAICSSEQEAQHLQGILTLPMVFPILILMLIIQSPNSTVSVVLSMIPFFSPMLMLARIVIVMPDTWQIVLSMLILAASIYGGIYFSSRVFRVGILMYGKRPGMREIVKWFRYA